MRADRLLKLADFLDTVDEEKFDYGVWGRINDMGNFEPQAGTSISTEELLKANCNTSACALGWCPTVWPEEWTNAVTHNWDNTRYELEPMLKSSGARLEEGAREFFEISQNIIDTIFYPAAVLYEDEYCSKIVETDEYNDEYDDNYVRAPGENASSKEVANYIRKVVDLVEKGEASADSVDGDDW